MHQKMSKDTARKAADIVLSSPQNSISVEFQGGEPLLNFDVIQYIVKYLETNKKSKEIQYSIVTNLLLLSENMIQFFKKYSICISTSLDGDGILHNSNRMFANGIGSFDAVIDGIKRLRNAGINVGAIETTTKNSLSKYKEIVDTYISLNFNTVFLRPLSPLGCAGKKWNEIGYSAEDYVAFYRNAMDYIIQKNKDGYNIQENYTSILLSKILHAFPANYMELRSPCGACTGQMAYYVNGDIFTCDEGRMLYEMGDASFKVGNVFDDDYKGCIKSSVCRTVSLASVLESAPGCCDCAFQPYCGICPVTNKALYNDLLPKMPNDYKCSINKGILSYIFEKIYSGDVETIQILNRWNV